MNLLTDIAVWHSLRPQVAHRLPGRLRLRVPLLTHLPDDWLDVATLLEATVAAPPGMLEVKTDRRTGSVLIRYDAHRLQAADVTDFLDALLRLLRRHRRRLAGLSPAQALRVAQKLKAWLGAQTRLRPMIDAEQDIPDAIWT